MRDVRKEATKKELQLLAQYYGENTQLLNSEIINIMENHGLQCYEIGGRVFTSEIYKKNGHLIMEEMYSFIYDF